MRLPIYLDHHSTTPVDERVLEEMLPFFTSNFGNASSIDHLYGLEGLHAVNAAREKVAHVIGAKYPDEIVFTSGATESDNLAIIGVAEKYVEKGKNIITCATEHKAILDTCKYLENKGWDITYLKTNKFGVIDLDELRSIIKDSTVLISIMIANNEIGTIAPFEDIGGIAKEKNIIFHTDATQAVGYIPINVEEMNIDLLSLSGHKIYGPKGIGALYIRDSNPRIRIAEQIHGGGHERGMRSGTLNVPGIVGLGKAIEICTLERDLYIKKTLHLRDLLWKFIQSNLDNVEINGHPEKRLPNNLNIYISGVENKTLITLLKNWVAFSTGSACSTNSSDPSHVIKALGYEDQRAFRSIRFGIGRFNTEEEIILAGEKIKEAVEKIRKIK